MKPLILAILLFLIYSSNFHGPFVFDDIPNIRENTHIHITELSFKKLHDAAFSGPCPNRPLPKVSFALNYYFHRHRVFGYHLVNILIHIITAVLLYYFIRQTLILSAPAFSDDAVSQIAFFAAGFWAVHPVQTQAVSYVVQRMTGMSAMFYIFSMYCYVKARLEKSPANRIILTASAFFGGLLAVGSKEIAATLPFFILLYDLYFFQKFKPVRRVVILGTVLALTVYSAVIVRVYLDAEPVAAILSAYDSRHFSPEQRILTQFRVMVFYISLILFPHPGRLNPDHDFSISYSILNPADTVISMAAVAGLILLAALTAKKHSLFSFSVFWFFGNLVIESSVIGLEIIFEHRLYLPSMMIFIAPVMSAYRRIRTKWLRLEILIVLMAVLSAWTCSRNFVWADDLALWQDSVRKSPNKDRPHVSLGVSLVRRGRFQEAEAHYREALRINPDNYSAHHNLAMLLDIESAIARYSEALRINPDFAEAHNNLGVAYAVQGNTHEAKIHFIKAMRITPDYKAPYNNLGNILITEGKFEEAEQLYRSVLDIDPEDAQANNNLGVVFMKKDMYSEAAFRFSEALRLNPGYPDAENNLKLCERSLKEQKDSKK